MNGQRYRAFISYSHRDREWGEWLHRALETYVVPKRLVGRDTPMGWVPPRLIPVFRDQEELPSASDLGGKVGEVLAHSDNLIVICSPEAAASRWVNREIQTFKQLGHADRIFCLIVNGEPNVADRGGDSANECFPPALRFGLGEDGELDPNIRAEPIAADIRAHRDGRDMALLKVVAGMLGVGVDDLHQREQARKHRRATAVAAISVVLGALMIVLGVQAILSGRAAERRQKQAEALVGYMLGDLNTKLGEVNRLDILAGVADHAMEYFESLPAGDLTETGLDQRVVALHTIAEMRLNQGQADNALKAINAALALSQKLARRSPENVDRQLAYAESLNWIGFVDWQQGRTAAAADRFSAAHAVLAANRAKAPDSPKMLAKIKDVSTNIAHVLEAEGKLDAAQSSYVEVLDVVRRLRKLEPSNSKWQVELGYAFNNLGVLAVKRGRLQEASDYFSDDLQIKRDLSAAEPQNEDLRSNVATALMFQSRLHGQLGDVNRATEEQREAMAMYRELQAADPENVANGYYLGLAQVGLLRLLIDGGRYEQAREIAGDARATLQKAASLDSRNPKVAMRALEARLPTAQLALQQGKNETALSIAGEVDRGLGALQPGDADLPEQARFRAIANLLMADASAVRDPGAAKQYRLKARAYMQTHITDTTRDPDLLDVWLRVAAELQVQPFPKHELERLGQTGYANPSFIAAMQRAGVDYTPRSEPVAATN